MSPSMNSISTGRPRAMMRLVRGSGIICKGVSSPEEVPPRSVLLDIFPAVAVPVARWTPAVRLDCCSLPTISLSVVASSVTSANFTLIKRVATRLEGLSIWALISMSLRIREVFSVIITEAAFGTAAMEPKAPNCPMIWVKVRTASSGLMWSSFMT